MGKKKAELEARDVQAPGQETMALQFKITLLEIQPQIWRRIQVPADYTFWDLHVAIQNAMGWEDCHLHEFRLFDPVTEAPLRIGIPDPDAEFGDIGQFPGWLTRIAETFVDGNDGCLYHYDFGDNWNHIVKFERAVPRDKRYTYPRCVKGARRCPPEDCGGVRGYAGLIEGLADKRHPRHRELREWVRDFNPEEFDSGNVRFDDPRAHLDKLFPYGDEA